MMENEKAKERFNHLLCDIKNDNIDLNAIICVLYHMGYLLVGKKELHEYTNRVKEEINDAHDATRIRIK